MALRLLRVVYAIEFLMAMAASMQVWREVGGQHLDLMPWYLKFFLSAGLSGAVVKLTAASTGEKRRPTVIWAAIVILLLLACGLTTYYYHLNEPLDEEDGTTLTASNMTRSGVSQAGVLARSRERNVC